MRISEKPKVTERLAVKNFFTVDEFDWEIKEFNVLTGAMGSGKSVCIKLLWFCERILHTLFFYKAITIDDLTTEAVSDRAAAAFQETFYLGNFDFSKTEIKYKYSCNGNAFDLQAVWDENKKRLNWSSSYIDNRLKKWQENFGNEKTKTRFDISIIVSNQIYKAITSDFHDTFPIGTLFIPAARAIATITDNTDFMDPFVNRFIKTRKWFEKNQKNIVDKDINRILRSTNIRYDDKQGLVVTLQNGCDITPQFLSSGQQELLYLTLMINHLIQTVFNIEDSPVSYTTRTSIYIEEPEAHSFPQNQKATMEYIVKAFRLFKESRKRNDRFFITTHSPYVLNVINNMLYKGHLIKEVENCSDNTKKTLIQSDIEKLDFSHLAADEISANFINNKVSNMVNNSKNGVYLYESMIEEISKKIDDDFENVKNLVRELERGQ